MAGQFVAEFVAGKGGVGILLLQPRALRPVPDHHLAAGPGHAEKGIDILFDGDAPDVGGNGARQLEKILQARPKFLGVHAALPMRQIAEPLRRQFLAHRSRAHHAAHGGAVKAAQRSVGDLHGNGESRPQILRKLRVIRGGEAYAPPQAKAPRAQSQRPLGGNMQRLGCEGENVFFDFFVREQRQPYFRIGRAGDATEILRRQHSDLVTKAPQPRRGLRQRADHTVGLRKPRIGDDHDSHEAPQWQARMTIR